MIYDAPLPNEPLDQGDLINGCPVVRVTAYTPGQEGGPDYAVDYHRVIVLTQTCDLANRLHTVRLSVLRALPRAGRLRTPYREHFAKHFADTFSRIGLPRPYETL